MLGLLGKCCWHCMQGSSDAWTLTNLLQTKQCRKYFDVLWGPEGTQPYVIVDLLALMSKNQLPCAQQLLQTVQTVRAHPKDNAYQATYNLHKATLTQVVCKPEPHAKVLSAQLSVSLPQAVKLA